MYKRFVALFSLFLAVTSLAQSANPLFQRAIDHPHRSEADRLADVHRHPLPVLQFSGVKAGDIVLDVFAGGGYYSELFAHVVGDKGRVDAFNNKPYLNWIGDQLRARLADATLKNVRRLDVEAAQLHLPTNHYDVILASMAFHDLYYADPAHGWPEIDATAMYRQLHQALKPHGVLIVIDHSARPGAGTSATQSLHRIDEQYLLMELEKNGFTRVAESNVLRNAQDTRDISSFEPRIRYQTDRFLWKLKKLP